ncbi:DUF3575 domain-containing protein [Portibacter marinus]|uniref:DUF3575 domain-containing protein n=1 Tax=Portibacter marinus TaxID=2898660 RepID=UPI001F16D126|nr:DUF3575 domain-containing protein [Portibacter marinus]
MKKISLLFIAFIISGTGLIAQQSAVKLGLGGLLVTAPNLRFEQALGDRISFQITGSYKFPSELNLSQLSSNTVSLTDTKISGFAIIPEFRIYFGASKAGTIEGFYLAPYLKYHRYGTSTTTSFTYTDPQGQQIPLNPELNIRLATAGAGLQLGYHFIIGEHFSLDWHFLGLGGDLHRFGLRYDFSREDLDLRDVAQFIIDEYNMENPDNPLEISDEELDQLPTSGKQIRLSTPIPFIGFRAGLSVGYAF